VFKHCRSLCLATAVTLLAALPGLAGADLRGQPAPDFALRSLGGPNLRLSELRGEVVLVNFWATWCGPCREEMPLLNQIYKQYHPVGFELLGVNIDDASGRAAEMARTLGVSFPVLFDDSKTVSRLYEVNTMPMTLLIGRDGTVRYLHQGYQRGTEQTYLDQIRELLKE
jgi:peroxiredoxin